VYFVHRYAAAVSDVTLARTDYGAKVSAVVPAAETSGRAVSSRALGRHRLARPRTIFSG